MRHCKLLLSIVLGITFLSPVVHGQQTYDSNKIIVVVDENILRLEENIEIVPISNRNDLSAPILLDLQERGVVRMTRALKKRTIPRLQGTALYQDQPYYWILEISDNIDVDEYVENIRNIEGIVQAFPLAYAYPSDYPNEETFDTSDTWGFYRSTSSVHVNAPAAWSEIKGDSSIEVAIIGSGIGLIADMHEEFNASGKFVYNYDSYNDTTLTHCDDIRTTRWWGHETCVAGIVAAINNNSGSLALGVLGGDYQVNNYGASILNIRSAGNSAGASSDLSIYRGVLAASANDADVINLSLESTASLPLTRGACADVYNSGVPIVVAMGNSDNSVAHYPAYFHDTVISVGAISSDGGRWRAYNYDTQEWEGSCMGDHIDVVAPTTIIAPGKTGDDVYHHFTGTSGSTPFVSGLVGMITDEDPGASPAKIEAIVRATGDRYPDQWSDELGFGLIDLGLALELLDEDGKWAKETTLSSPSWTEITSGYTKHIGEYFYNPVEVRFDFETNRASDDNTMIWVEPEDSDGTLISLETVTQMNNIGYGAAKASTFDELSEGRIEGEIITYTWRKYNVRGQTVGYVPLHPSSITVTYTQWGKLKPSVPTGLQGEYVDEYGVGSVELEWNRSGTEEGVTRYKIERADGEEGGSFYHLGYQNNSGGGSKVY